MYWLVIAAVAIVVILACVAGYYLFLLRSQNMERQKKMEEVGRLIASNREKNVKSIIILAKAILQDEVTLTEASIRINSISQSLNLNDEAKEKLSVFSQLATATSHIPILAEWKRLPRKEKLKYDKQRLSTEEKYKDFVVSAAKNIIKDSSFLHDGN